MDNMRLEVIVGHLGRNIEVKYTPTGKLVGNFSLAVEVGFGDRKHTEWIDCTVWGINDKILLAEWAGKGTKVWLEGTPAVQVWKNKEGEPQGKIVLTVRDWRVLSGGKSKEEAATPYDGDEEAEE